MKFQMKTSYIYIAAVVIAVAVLVIFTNMDKKKDNTKDMTNKEMSNNEGTPSKSNVNEKVLKQLDLMKEDMSKTPNDTSKMRILADLLTTSHKPDEAISYYDQILKKDPKRKDILFSLAFAYYQKKDFNQAEETTNRILKLDKNDLQAQYNLGAIAASKGETAKARELWVRFIQEHPKGELSDLARNNLTQLK